MSALLSCNVALDLEGMFSLTGDTFLLLTSPPLVHVRLKYKILQLTFKEVNAVGALNKGMCVSVLMQAVLSS